MAEGYTMQAGESMVSPARATITTGYFEAMGIPLLRGRLFNERDNASAPAVIMIDERLAQKFWPGTDPVGKRMYVPDTPQDLAGPNERTQWLTVIGVVSAVRLEDLSAQTMTGAYYFPTEQQPQRSLTLAIKTAGDVAPVLQALRARVKEFDLTMVLVNERTMNEYAALSLISRRTTMLLAMSFAVVSLFLCAVGIYGVLSFLVTQRFREIGIRIALGSTSLGIFSLVLREGMILIACGLALGFAGTAALDQTLQSQIFGLGTMDPIVMALMMLILGLVALAACSVPARRATQVDPVAVLNQQ
jgi:hypothetical protein